MIYWRNSVRERVREREMCKHEWLLHKVPITHTDVCCTLVHTKCYPVKGRHAGEFRVQSQI